MPTKTNDSIIAQILSLHQQGLKDKEIADKLGTSKTNVHHYLEGRRVVHRRKKGDKTPITDDIRRQIIQLHAGGLNDWEIASELDIGKSTVSSFLLGKRVINHKPRRQYTGDGHIICSICKHSKSSDEFGSPRSNGRTISESSFCKECQRDKTFKRLSDPLTYLRKRVNDLAARSRKLGVIFRLTVEDAWRIYTEQRGKCFYTGEQMALAPRSKVAGLRTSLSFDKVVPERGYEESNVVLCTYKANAVKQDLTLDEIRDWLPGWYQKLKACSRLGIGNIMCAL